jgi:RNA polymerase sigma factor (sigma-70 family)
MSSDLSVKLQGLLARCLADDESARQELIHFAYERLRSLARVILNESFPRLKAAPALLETTDVANEAALGMYQLLAEIRPATVNDFFRLAAQRIRWLLLNRAKQSDRWRRYLGEAQPAEGTADAGEDAELPATLEALYRQIDSLPDKEREVVDLLCFHGLTREEAAALLGVTERSVRRYWAAARIKLAHGLQHLVAGAADAD